MNKKENKKIINDELKMINDKLEFIDSLSSDSSLDNYLDSISINDKDTSLNEELLFNNVKEELENEKNILEDVNYLEMNQLCNMRDKTFKKKINFNFIVRRTYKYAKVFTFSIMFGIITNFTIINTNNRIELYNDINSKYKESMIEIDDYKKELKSKSQTKKMERINMKENINNNIFSKINNKNMEEK